MKILAIESSCDDTSASVIDDDRVLSNVVASQIEHKDLGGVVPELASRKHLLHIIATVDHALKGANTQKTELDAIAVTRGPGLLGSLIVGVNFAKSLALALQKPLIEVHHMEAHILAHFAESPSPSFPFLCLTVSGGHTQIVRVNSPSEMQILGSTIDDAAGEAFDKTGKLLGLPYPAGPEIDRRASKGNPIFSYAKPRIEGLNFSFSGLKTSILYDLRKRVKENPRFVEEHIDDICASVQKSIVDILIEKLIKASEQENIKEVAIAGGVSANSGLRNALLNHREEHSWNVYIPKTEYCTDNAAMIAVAARFKYKNVDFADQSMTPDPRLAM